jgi:alanine racemase
MKAFVINREDLRKNIENIQRKVEVPVIGVLKGDGYGLGMLQLAQQLQLCDVNWFAVTEVNDALALRSYGFEEQHILVMRSTSIDSEVQTLLETKAVATIGSYDAAVKLNNLAEQAGVIAEAHLKLDTGMGRYGFLPSEFDRILNVYTCFKNLHITGIYTHFSSSFAAKKITIAQLDQLLHVVDLLKQSEVDPGMVHAANSTAALRFPETRLDAVRIGSAFTGRSHVKGRSGLVKIGALKSCVIETRWLPAGHSIGYGGGFVTKRPTEIAVIPVGYIDGFAMEKTRDLFRVRDCLRYLFHDFKLLLKRKSLTITVAGVKVPVLGHVGMCHTTVDITNMNIHVGDEAVFDLSPLVVSPNVEKIYE